MWAPRGAAGFEPQLALPWETAQGSCLSEAPAHQALALGAELVRDGPTLRRQWAGLWAESMNGRGEEWCLEMKLAE